MSDYELEKLEAIKLELKSGLSNDEIVRSLNNQGLTITESMKLLVSECGISLEEAKRIVSNHEVWGEVVSASEPLHEEIIECTKKID